LFDGSPDVEIGGEMRIQLQVEKMSGYLAASFTGVGPPGAATQRFELISEHCKRTNNNKLLIDFTGFKLNATTIDRYLAGIKSQIFARYRLKVAVICTPEQIDPEKFGVLVAQNRGVDVEVFTDFRAAEEWLLKSPGSRDQRPTGGNAAPTEGEAGRL